MCNVYSTPLTPVSKTELHSYAYCFNVSKCYLMLLTIATNITQCNILGF